MALAARSFQLTAVYKHSENLPTPQCARAPQALVRRRRIIVLDDEPALLRTWQAILEAHGFEPVCCQRAADALGEVARGCDLVMTDYHMPDMTGIEVIRAAQTISSVNVMVMTANDSPRLRGAALAAGAACVVAKPAPIKSVIEIIEKLCG